ncbi:hypothetical protein N7468_009221 [Penicillium chermesinum]|uniref:Uncharacterized protein n=1 Tax=Penicillium chermesinum TaxID=63820 RepID=A0A9W9NHD1_9EURO|nr:uncharacterized protein N7468_009221 [Penicillium chermesinum]KAJ5220017.1 hypothetical protein N7468_009221 [Penicillium chermesinum]
MQKDNIDRRLCLFYVTLGLARVRVGIPSSFQEWSLDIFIGQHHRNNELEETLGLSAPYVRFPGIMTIRQLGSQRPQAFLLLILFVPSHGLA